MITDIHLQERFQKILFSLREKLANKQEEINCTEKKNEVLKFRILSMMLCWSSLKDLAFGLCLVLSKTTYKILCGAILRVSCSFRRACVRCLFRGHGHQPTADSSSEGNIA